MKIKQGYASAPMRDFEFVEKHRLPQMSNNFDPLVVFGCYKNEDVDIIKNHKGTVVVQWEGLDSKMKSDPAIFCKSNVINVSPLPPVTKYLNEKGITCRTIKYITVEKPQPQILGDKIYAYVNKNNRPYYGGLIIDMLKSYPLLVADYTIPMKVWKQGFCNEYYSQAFISLALSEFAGGGFSIVELGLRGVKVVTNILDLPCTLKWENINSIKSHIIRETAKIGTIDKELAFDVYDDLVDLSIVNGYDLEILWL